MVKNAFKALLSAPESREEWRAWRGLTAAFFAVCLLAAVAVLVVQ